MSDEKLKRRVEELESLVSFQERTIATLDEVVRGFAGRVETLERELEKVKGSVIPDQVGPQDDPPPHYADGQHA